MLLFDRLQQVLRSKACLPLLCCSMAYLWGILSTQHIQPDSTDLFVNLYVALILAVGIAIGMWRLRPQTISKQVAWWLAALLLVAVQPALHSLAYVDMLVFPAGSLLLCAGLAWILSDLDGLAKKRLADGLAYTLLLGGCLTVLTQFIQAVGWVEVFSPYVFPLSSGRLIGNIAQVNQAAFVAAMGLAALPYLYYTRPDKIRTGFYVLAVVWLSIGFGFAASRGGLILALAAVFGSALFYAQAWKKRLAVMTVMLGLAVAGYSIGTYLLNLWVAPELSAVGRFVSGHQRLRLSQLAQAWQAFADNPFTGVGYGMIKGYGIHHAEEIPWFTIGHHVHNIVGQIAAELGLLGLAVFGGFVWLVLRNWRIAGMQPEKALAYAVLAIIALYSLSEYPLWFMRFLMLVPVCLALIDSATFRVLTWRPYLAVSAVFVLVAAASWFYIDRYRWYATIYYYLIQDDLPQQKQVEAFKDLPVVFGYYSYRDMMLYSIADYDMQHLRAHIDLGERSLQIHFSQGALIKQGNLYALAHDWQNAGKYYRAACVMDFSRECGKVITALRELAESDRQTFGQPLADFSLWYRERFGQPMPEGSNQPM